MAGLSVALIAAVVATGASLRMLATPPPHTVFIDTWYGGTGNNFAQMVNALYYAEVMGLRRVKFPEGRLDQQEWMLTRLPSYIEVEPNPRVRGSDSCISPSQFKNTTGGLIRATYMESKCEGGLNKEYRRLMMKYIKPMLNDQMRGRCDAKVKEGFDGLTIHLRSGDVLTRSSIPQGRFAPCSFFDKVIHDHHFRKVLVVAQDMDHPCIEALRSRHRDINVTVQASSRREDDICAIMTARNFAHGTFSSFAMSWELMNSRLERNFKPGACQRCVDRGQPTRHGPRTFCYSIQGMDRMGEGQPGKEEHNREGQEKFQWMLRTGVEAIKLNGTCNEEDDVPYQGSYFGKRGVILQLGRGSRSSKQ